MSVIKTTVNIWLHRTVDMAFTHLVTDPVGHNDMEHVNDGSNVGLVTIERI